MASRFHKSRLRRAERSEVVGHGNINLVPLVDILTSIVFFSLLTYTGAAMAAMTAFNLSLPPVVVTGEQARNAAPDKSLNLLLAVRITGDGLQVEHSNNFSQRIAGLDSAALGQLQQVMAGIKRQYPQNDDVLVVPDDQVSYDEIIHVLDHIRDASYTNISLGSRSRGQLAQNVSNPGPGGR